MAEWLRPWEVARAHEAARRRPRRRLGPTLAALLAAILASAGAVALTPARPVAAQQSCFQDDAGKGPNGTNWECQWTQLENSWPDNNYPSCSPCVAYRRYLTLNASINQSNANHVAFHDDMANAVYSWSGQPYNSPWFNDCKCGSAFLNINAAHYGAGICGEGGVTYDSNNGNAIVGAFANYNIDATFVDSPNSAGTCDARSVAVHEVGHAFAEGHSSYPSDVMNWKDCQCATIDQDAQSMLNAVYGPENSSSSGSSRGGCGSCQVAPDGGGSGVGCTTVGVQTICGTPDLAAYYWKAWYLSQGAGDLVPADPQTNPVMLITPDHCLTHYYSKQYVAWLQCTTA
jgi:hypothetical protein